MPLKSAGDTGWVRAYEWMKEAIDSCRFPMGAQLPETHIAKEAGVSRTPVREALRVLERDGYVKIIPKRGAFVSEISIDDVREIYEIRKLLEPFAALSAASRIPDAEIRELSAEWEQLRRRAENGELTNFSDFADKDIKMHLTIARYAANGRICAILKGYYVQIRRFQRLSVQSLADVRNSIGQHVELIERLKDRDPYALRLCLYDHVAAGEGFIMKGCFLLSERASDILPEKAVL